MEHIHIKEFCKHRTQAQIGEIMGLTQGAVSLAIKANRTIFFVEAEDGSYTFYEIRKPRKAA